MREAVPAAHFSRPSLLTTTLSDLVTTGLDPVVHVDKWL
jgi:hypothetical protein